MAVPVTQTTERRFQVTQASSDPDDTQQGHSAGITSPWYQCRAGWCPDGSGACQLHTRVRGCITKQMTCPLLSQALIQTRGHSSHNISGHNTSRSLSPGLSCLISLHPFLPLSSEWGPVHRQPDPDWIASRYQGPVLCRLYFTLTPTL